MVLTKSAWVLLNCQTIMRFEPVKTHRISEEIATQIKAKLLSFELKPEDKLPSENDLADMFGASRATVREALRSLEAAGLIMVKRGAQGGSFVTGRGLERAGETLSEALRLRGVPLEQVTEARLLVEPTLARLAAERATDEDRATIEATLSEVEAKLQGGLNLALANLAFHRSVAGASHNTVLVVILSASLDILIDAIGESPIERTMVEQMLASHRNIYAAIAGGDGERAFHLMAEHVHEAHRGLSVACLLR